MSTIYNLPHKIIELLITFILTESKSYRKFSSVMNKTKKQPATKKPPKPEPRKRVIFLGKPMPAANRRMLADLIFEMIADAKAARES